MRCAEFFGKSRKGKSSPCLVNRSSCCCLPSDNSSLNSPLLSTKFNVLPFSHLVTSGCVLVFLGPFFCHKVSLLGKITKTTKAATGDPIVGQTTAVMEDTSGWSASVDARLNKNRHLCHDDISSQMGLSRSEPALIAVFRLRNFWLIRPLFVFL